jgi:hypothetical protein
MQKRYSEADFVMKVAWKIALYNLVFSPAATDTTL